MELESESGIGVGVGESKAYEPLGSRCITTHGIITLFFLFLVSLAISVSTACTRITG